MTKITKAKRGDGVLIETISTATYAIGSGRGTERRSEYQVGIVTSITREGLVKAYDHYTEWGSRIVGRKNGNSHHPGALIIPKEKVGDVEKLIMSLNKGFDSVDAARDAIKAWIEKNHRQAESVTQAT